jgi:hypothetical protein
MNGLYAYPKSCAFGRVISKAKLFGAAKAGTSLREKYTQQVSQIRWAYKLYPEGLNLTGSQTVPEIQIFSVALKTPNIDQVILSHIDKAVTYPIIFEVTFEGRVKTLAAYKRPSDTGRGQWVCSDYFETEWRDSHSPRAPLPIALNLEGLYRHLVRALMPYPAKEGESLQAQATRIAEIKTQEKTCEQLKSKVSKEKQFNRRVAYNQELKAAETKLGELTG